MFNVNWGEITFFLFFLFRWNRFFEKNKKQKIKKPQKNAKNPQKTWNLKKFQKFFSKMTKIFFSTHSKKKCQKQSSLSVYYCFASCNSITAMGMWVGSFSEFLFWIIHQLQVHILIFSFESSFINIMYLCNSTVNLI